MTRPDSGSRHAAVFGHGDGSAMALLLAATNPDRLTALILADGYATRVRVPRTHLHS